MLSKLKAAKPKNPKAIETQEIVVAALLREARDRGAAGSILGRIVMRAIYALSRTVSWREKRVEAAVISLVVAGEIAAP